jgi:hypothetical protein
LRVGLRPPPLASFCCSLFLLSFAMAQFLERCFYFYLLCISFRTRFFRPI